MYDIHTHILFGVDDGAKTQQESIDMLIDAKKQGVKGMILTPHYRRGMFAYPKEQVEENFIELKQKADSLGIELYLGTEYHVNSLMIEHIKEGRCHTMVDSNYVLAEYKPETEFSYIKASVQDLLLHGYIPIVAHVERYECMQDIKRVSLLREIGVMIQVNADAIIGKDGFKVKGYTQKLLKKGCVDFVGSDSHGIHERRSNMGKCRDYLYKKFDEAYVDKILEVNPRKIIENEE